jgi:zinc transport system substrate-binding protein
MKKILILIAFLAIIAGCKTNNKGVSDQKPIVTVSILPQKFFIDRISGNLIDVNVMVPEGSDPHIYEPTAKQMKDLSNSDAYFKIGYIEFELAWLEKFTALNPTMKIVDHAKNADLITPEHDHDDDHGDHHHHGVDPHIWSSLTEAKKICQISFDNLIELYPQYKNEFEVNFKVLSNEMDSLDSYIKEKLETLEGKKFMIYHSALAYYARDYKLEQVSIETDGKEPTPMEIKNIIELALKENIKVIFVQKQFNTHSAEVLAKEINGRVVQVDPLGYDWIQITKLITDEIALIYSAE